MYLVAGDHADTLASGQPISPGDELRRDAVNLEHPNDQRLIADRVLLEIKPAKKAARGRTEETS